MNISANVSKGFLLNLLFVSFSLAGAGNFIFEVPAATKEERTFISNLGFAIDEVQSDRVFILGDNYDRNLLKRSGVKFTQTVYQPKWDKQTRANKYRSYADVISTFKALAQNNPDIASYQVL